MIRQTSFRTLLILPFLICFFSSCVSSKKFKAQVAEANRLDSLNRVCNDRVTYLTSEVGDLRVDTTEMGRDIRDLIEKYNVMMTQSLAKEELLSTELRDKQEKLKTYEQFLVDREQKVRELQSLLRRQDSLTNALLSTVKNALTGFSKEELTVNIKDGRVYVSLSEQLLFPSGSYTVNPKGRDAIEKLANVLVQNPEIEVMIEGHTDDRPIKTNCIRDNWDLSVMRATSVVNILTKTSNIVPTRLTACGKGEFQPIATNNTSDGRQLNRRTEIILSPKLDELYRILDSTQF